MTAALEIEGIRKTFGDKVAIESLDLTIPQGATYGLIGPSGAGKTTAIRMIMSILFPDRGTISVFGGGAALNIFEDVEERGVGIVFEQRVLETASGDVAGKQFRTNDGSG